MPPARRGDNFFIYGGEAVDSVRVSADGLHGHMRDAALAVGERLREARSVAELSAHLKDAAEDIAEATGGVGHIAVERGESPGHVTVAFRPPARLFAFDAGLDPRRLEPSLRLRAEQALPRGPEAPEGREPPRETMRASVVVDSWVDSMAAAARLESSDRSQTWRPALEVGARHAGAGRIQGPCLAQQVSAGLCVADAAGKHEARIEMALRELVPKKGASQELLRGPLRNAKLSAIYRYLGDSRSSVGAAAGGVARARAEVATVEGETGLLRCEATWFGARPWLHGTSLDLRAACGLAVGARALEDRFRIGGAFGGPAERLPGFSSGGLGPFGQRVGKGGGRDYLGGTLHASTTVAARWPLRFRDEVLGLRWHLLAFGAAGALRGEGELDVGLRASAGIGVGAALPRDGFLGVTLAQPFLRRPGDRCQRLQLWITLGSTL